MAIQMFNLGPPAVDTFSMIGNLGKSFFDAYDAQRRRAAEDRERQLKEEAIKLNRDMVTGLGGADTPAPAQGAAVAPGLTPTPAPQPRPPTFAQTGGQMRGVNTSGFVPEVASLVDEFRQTFPEVRITSGYRDPSHNARVGGARGSQHVHGKAFDFSVRGLPEERQVEIANWLRSKGARGFGYYPNSQSMHADLGEQRFWGPSYSRDSLGQTPQWFQRFAGTASPVAPPSGPPPVAQRSMTAYAGVPSPAPRPVQVASAAPGLGYAPVPAAIAPMTGVPETATIPMPPSPYARAPAPAGSGSYVPFDEAVPGANAFGAIGGINGTPTMPLPSFTGPTPAPAAPGAPQAAVAPPQAPAPVRVAQASPAAPVASDAGTVDPIAAVFRRLSPAQQQLYRRALSNPYTAPAAMERLKSMVKQDTVQIVQDGQGNSWMFNQATRSWTPAPIPGKPTEFQRFKGEDGTEYAWNPKDPKSAPIPISKAGGFRNLITPEERLAAGIPPDDKRPAQLKPNGELFFPSKAQTEVTTNINPGENEQKKVIGKFYGERFTEIQKAGNSSLGIKNTLRLMENATNDPNFYSGMGGEKMTAFKQGLSAVGINPNAAAPNELFRSLANDVVLGKLGGSLGTGIATADVTFMQATVPNLANTIPGNKAIIVVARKLADRQQVVAKMAREYAAKNGGQIDAGFDDMLAQWAEANPLFGEKDMAEINAAMKGPPVPQPTASAAPPTGPKKGDVVDGWTFLGGDPSNPKSWKK